MGVLLGGPAGRRIGLELDLGQDRELGLRPAADICGTRVGGVGLVLSQLGEAALDLDQP